MKLEDINVGDEVEFFVTITKGQGARKQTWEERRRGVIESISLKRFGDGGVADQGSCVVTVDKNKSMSLWISELRRPVR